MESTKPSIRSSEIVDIATTVHALYKTLSSGEREISGLIASDLEWWFHGPHDCHHMMKMLTGTSSQSEFKFDPKSINPIDPKCVVVEGWEGKNAYWVHVWTLQNGVIINFREYFNTWLTVTMVRAIDRPVLTTLWQSYLHRQQMAKRSLPEIVLAI